jgi:TatD DNase family protein
MGLFDVHAHLTHARLFSDVPAVIEKAQQAGLTTIISNGLNPADNARVLELSQRYEMVRPAFGLYPVDAVMAEMMELGVDYPRDEEQVWTAEEAVDWVREHVQDCFAVGEIGLDGYWVPEALWERQEWAFRELVQVAMDADKPIIIHSRKRERRAFEVLVEMGAERVNWHCYGSKVKRARRIAEHGHYFSIPANVRRSQSFSRMVQTLPRDRLLLETDCPYLGPVPGERNEPMNVAGTLEFFAQCWQMSAEDVLEVLSANFERLFGVPP